MGRFGSYLMSYDSFGETFKMRLDSDLAALPSIMGTILSFISTCLVIGYTVQKLDILISRKDVDIVLAVRDNYLTDSDAFTGRQGMNVAFALTGFDSVRENILDPEYASI